MLSLPKLIVYVAVFVCALTIIGSYVGWSFLKSNENLSPSPSPTPTPSHIAEPTNSTEPETSPTGNGIPDTNLPDDSNSSETQDNPTIYEQSDQVRSDALAYIEAKHPETAFLLPEDEWQVGNSSTSANGAEKIDYYNSGWNVTVQVSQSINPIFAVTVKFAGIWQVSWQGTEQDSMITELSYSSNIPKSTPAPI